MIDELFSYKRARFLSTNIHLSNNVSNSCSVLWNLGISRYTKTHKTIDRKSNDIVFYQNGERLLPYKLSSGEKQMLVILLTVLVRDDDHCVLFMDEPEASLHIEWQQKLIGMIRSLNPNVQLILTTHSPLKHNLTSAYLDAARKLSPKRARRRIVAYVESYDDIAFWRTLLSEFENEERYFQVMLPSATSLAKGKKMVLMNTLNTSELGRSLIACVDSDYDFLLQGATKVSHRINKSPYIFQTYGYAIENFHCFADSLHEVCVQATLNDRHILDFPAFLKRYSQIAYPLFLWNVWFYRQHDTHTFPMYDFNACVRLQEINLRHPYRSLDEMQKTVSAKLSELQARFPRYIDRVEQLGTELERLGLTPDNTYLYIQGHHIMDCVVLKILIPVCTVLRREREQEIKRLAEHNEQFRNELTGYENSQVNVSVMLKKNSGYKNLYLYQWLKEDIMEFLEREEQSRR